MTPPSRIDAGTTTTVPSATNAGAQDASALTDASMRTDTSPPVTTGASPDARTASPSPPHNAETAEASRSTRSPLTFEVDGFVGPGRLGGPNGTVFSPAFSPANEGWNHTRVGIGVGFNYRLWNPI